MDLKNQSNRPLYRKKKAFSNDSDTDVLFRNYLSYRKNSAPCLGINL